MNKIVDESYFDLLIDNNLVEFYQNSNTNQVFPINPKACLLTEHESLFQMDSIGTYPYSFFPSLFTLNSDICTNSNIDKIQNNPNFSLYGQGVVVGIIDTGIDYQHSAFRYPDGSSRILSIWDQTMNYPEQPPDGFSYGTEYPNDLLNLALANPVPQSVVPSTDDVGHGTMIAGIIGGNPDPEHFFAGIVPQCEFLIVKLKPAKINNKKIFCVPEDKLCYEETDVISGLSYLTEKARKLHRPLALCLAMGTSQGGHNGKGATSGYLSYITQSPHSTVAIAAGDEGNRRRHFFSEIKQPFYTDFELNVDPKDSSFSMEIWAGSPYRLSLDITTPGGEVIRSIYPRINECRKLDFIFTPSTIWLNNIVSESDTGSQLILIRFQKAYAGIWRFRVYSIDQEPTSFHVWLPADDLISTDTFLMNSNSECTITSPGNAETPFVIANYNEKTGSIAPDSSRGFTRDSVIKPDLAAPGCDITAPLPNQKYGTLTGTGASAAHATGIMAMILEWAVVRGYYSVITGSDINQMLIRGAYRDKQTDYPNKHSGYGLMDIYGLFEKLV